MRAPVSVFAVLGLVACNQIAGIKKPDDGTSSSSSTSGTGTSSTDDTGATTGTTFTSSDEFCGPSGCGTGETCRHTTSGWACSAAASGAAGDSCSVSGDCGASFDCVDGHCYAYCLNVGEVCVDEAHLCVTLGTKPQDWGGCFSPCTLNDTRFCVAPETCVVADPLDPNSGGVCAPPSVQ